MTLRSRLKGYANLKALNIEDTKKEKRFANLSYFLGWSAFRLMYSTYFRWKVYGAENVPETGPAILVSNHASFLDPPLVGSGLKRGISYLARDTLFRYPGVGALLRSWQAVPVDRDGGGASGIRNIMERLNAGHAVLVFPEGTRTRDGALQKARSGIGLIILKTKVPVVPVRVFGTFDAFGKHRKIPVPSRVSVVYGKPLLFEEERAKAVTAPKAELKSLYQSVAERIMSEIAKLEPPQN